MITPHQLEPDLFDGLASGGGGAAAIEALRSAQLSKHLLLIRHLLGRWPGPRSERDAIADALDRARQQSAQRFGDVLGAPLVGAWSAIASRADQRGGASPADFAHLAALAVVACATTGVDAAAEVPVRDGVVTVPGLGAVTVAASGAEFADAPGVGKASLIASAGRLTVRSAGAAVEVPLDPSSDGLSWQPVRHLEAASGGHQIRLGLDDLDPYRHGHHAPPARRLPADEVDRWRGLFADAWQLLGERTPDRAAELAAGLRTLIPLVQGDERAARSATIRHAFGVFGLTRPPSAAEFAVTLVHEFQHSKLSAMLDLMPLSDVADRGRYFAPWRVDPRPLAGLLQGVYAFVGVADTWRALREVDAIASAAEARFAEARLQVDRGLTSVEQSGALTPAGVALAAGLRRVTDTMLAQPVPAATARAAEQSLEQIRLRWVDQNSSLT
jgi:HEXXH motif-containing protein